MRVFEVKMIDEGEDYLYINLLNHALKLVEDGSYKEGYRNNIILDFVIGCEYFELDPFDLLSELMKDQMITESMDDEYPLCRMDNMVNRNYSYYDSQTYLMPGEREDFYDFGNQHYKFEISNS